VIFFCSSTVPLETTDEGEHSHSQSPAIPAHLIPVLPSSETDQFMTPQDSSPSLQSVSNGSPPITPCSNNTSDDINNNGSDFTRRNTFASSDDQMDLGFVLVSSDNLSNSAEDMSEPVEDVEHTLRAADFKKVINQNTSTEVGMDYDTAVPAGDNDTVVILNKNKSAKNSSMFVEDQVIGLPGSQFSINEDESSVDSPLPIVSGAKILDRRNSNKKAMISLPELRITRLTSFGATSPEYFTPTDRMLSVCMCVHVFVCVCVCVCACVLACVVTV